MRKRWVMVFAVLLGAGIAVSARQIGRQRPAPVHSTAEQILQQVAQIPVYTWSYRWRPGVRHIGPMAQNFQTFGFGSNPRTIHLLDAFGVLLAATQALYVQVQRLQAQQGNRKPNSPEPAASRMSASQTIAPSAANECMTE